MKILFQIASFLIFCVAFNPIFASFQNWSDANRLTILNSNKNDFAPIFNKWNNHIYFASDKSGKSQIYEISIEDFLANKNANKLKSDFNIANTNIAYLCFENSELAYYTAFKMKKNRSYQNLYYSKSRKDIWTQGIELPELAWENYVGQSTISEDGRAFVFISDKNSEYKDTDIWISYRQNDGTFGEASKLGILNSPGNEISPHFLGSDTLYFSSDGQKGPGGFDIYYSIKQDGEWQRPQAFTEVNTEFNESDIAFINSEQCLFASNRNSIDNLDLFEVKKFEKKEEKQEQKTADLELSISSFVSSIRIIDNYDYQVAPLQTYLYFQQNTDPTFNFRTDSLSQKSLKTIADRLKENKSSIISIITFYVTESELDKANQRFIDFTEYMYAVHKIDVMRFKHETKQTNEKKQYSFMISEDCKLFEADEIKNSNFMSEPQLFGVELNARPFENCTKWNFYLIMQNDTIQISNGNKLPADALISLQNYASKLINNDFFEIRLSAFDKNNEKFEYTDTIQIIRTVSKKQMQESSDGRPELTYYYVIDKKEDALEYKCQEELLKDFLAGFKPSQIRIDFNAKWQNNVAMEYINEQLKTLYPKAKITNNPLVDSLAKNIFKLNIR